LRAIPRWYWFQGKTVRMGERGILWGSVARGYRDGYCGNLILAHMATKSPVVVYNSK